MQDRQEVVIDAEPVPNTGTELATVTPMQLLQLAVSGGANVDQLAKLMDIRREWEADEARKAFAEAMVRFKADPPKIYKNAQVDFTSAKGRTNYKHATLDNVNDLIAAGLQKVGISAEWETEQFENGLIRVTCVLTHVKGHSKRVWLQAGRDDSGSKNSIQAVVSTVTYLERQTLLSATGMAVSNSDDDGRQGVGTKTMAESDKAEWSRKIAAASNRREVESMWTSISAECVKLGDVATNNELRAEVAAKIKALGSKPAAASPEEGVL